MEEEKKRQVAAQCKAVQHLAETLAAVHRDYSLIFEGNIECVNKLIDLVGDRTASFMETLGDMLNEMDAASEDDKWMNSVFEKAHQMFPQPRRTK